MKTLQKKIMVGLILFTNFNLHTYAQNKTITYVGDTVTMFANPERGWYGAFSPDCCDKIGTTCSSVPLDMKPPHNLIALKDLQALRDTPEKITLYRDLVKISQWSGPIPQTRLTEIQTDFNTARKAGVKVLVRILYNYGMEKGEPCENIISGHLDQLKPIMENNADVIFCVQAGLFGGSGEACCESWLLGENNNGWSSLSLEAIGLYKKLIGILPTDRFMVLRYPRYTYQMNGWSNSSTQSITAFPSGATPLTSTEAYTGSLQSRLGYLQDNFAGDIYGFGFFNAWEQKDIDFVTADTKYALMEGELSWGTEYNKNNGAALMKRDRYTAFHYSTFGGGYEGGDQTIPTWKANGQYNTMGIRLGYRFRLINASIPQTLSSNGKFTMSMTMKNDGWARIANPRNVEIIFRRKSDGTKYTIKIDGDGRGNRLWLPSEGETKTLNISNDLPSGIAPGIYDLYLNLPDPYASLHDNPLYSIRLGNTGIWDELTGYNSLLTSVNINNPTGNALPSYNIQLTISPNPAKDALKFTGDLSANTLYEIFSVDGKLILMGILQDENLSIEGLKTGIYIIKIKTDMGVNVQRFVKE